jgi:hypothetical protein
MSAGGDEVLQVWDGAAVDALSRLPHDQLLLKVDGRRIMLTRDGVEMY